MAYFFVFLLFCAKLCSNLSPEVSLVQGAILFYGCDIESAFFP